MPQANHATAMTPPLAVVLLFSLHNRLIAQAQEHWPQFRGPESRGVAGGPNLPDRWSATENVAWKTDVPGRGWSSPVVWGERVFLTTAVNSGELETPKKGLYFGGNRPEPRQVQLDYKVLCLDLASGRKLWEQSVHQGPAKSPIHLKNSYASETPVTDGERVYAYFGNQGLYCLDREGKLVWSRPFEPHATRNGWGTSASPVLHGEHLYIVNDNDEESYLLCLDKRNGQDVWRVLRDEKSNWATPFIWQNDRRTEIVTPGTGKVRSYDLEGKLLWWFTGARWDCNRFDANYWRQPAPRADLFIARPLSWPRRAARADAAGPFVLPGTLGRRFCQSASGVLGFVSVRSPFSPRRAVCLDSSAAGVFCCVTDTASVEMVTAEVSRRQGKAARLGHRLFTDALAPVGSEDGGVGVDVFAIGRRRHGPFRPGRSPRQERKQATSPRGLMACLV